MHLCCAHHLIIQQYLLKLNIPSSVPLLLYNMQELWCGEINRWQTNSNIFWTLILAPAVRDQIISISHIPYSWGKSVSYFHFALCSTCELCDNNMCVTKTKQEILHIHTEHRRSAFFPILIWIVSYTMSLLQFYLLLMISTEKQCYGI